jgi:hypothetical protein
MNRKILRRLAWGGGGILLLGVVAGVILWQVGRAQRKKQIQEWVDTVRLSCLKDRNAIQKYCRSQFSEEDVLIIVSYFGLNIKRPVLVHLGADNLHAGVMLMTEDEMYEGEGRLYLRLARDAPDGDWYIWSIGIS